MSRDNKRILIGIAVGFLGMFCYCILLEGVEYINMEDILDITKQLAVPLIFTEIFGAIFIEGLGNLKKQFIEFKEKLNKKFTKEAET